MCGISGIIFNQNFPVDREIHSMTNAINSRGPDGNKIIIGENFALGHNHLKIVDSKSKLSNQPFYDNSMRYIILFNGELYNYKKLKSDLEQKGFKFYSDTDTEVILNSFIASGNECVKKFEGMWSFAIWDNKKKKIFISRDKYGIKPLFYAIENNILYFSSQTKSLLTIDKLKSFNSNILNGHYFYNDYDSSIIINKIKNLLPGHSLEFDLNFLKIIKWRNENIPKKNSLKYDEQKNLFSNILSETCSSHLIGDKKIAISLSGGIDSTSLFCIYQNQNSNIVPFVTIFKDSVYDESDFINLIERTLILK